MSSLAVFLTVALAQAPAETPAPNKVDQVDQAVQAAQKAAEAAQKAAEAAAAATAAKAPEPIPASPAPPAPGEKKDTWRGLVGVGLIALTGNAETLTGTANAQADKTIGAWGVGLRLNGAYGQTRPQDGGQAQVTALKAAGSLRGERQFVDFASGFLQGGLETDHIKSVELREYAELGSGLKLFERKEGDFERLYLRFDIAFRYQNESRYQYIGDDKTPTNTALPGVAMVAPHFGVVFRYSLNKGVHFSEEAEVLPNLVGASRVIVNSTTKLAAQLTETFSLSGSYIVNFDSAPAGDKKTTDTALTLGLEAAF